MKTQEIRDAYREFFVERGHEAWPSDSLVPKNDPTLLFSSAGMVQFKPYFLGEMGDTLKRATTCQKCFRTSDIEEVGYTERHHTFFEMLGNFSFGDYFKQDAIRWAWEFSVDVMKIPKEKIWVSIYEDDDESGNLWKQETDISPSRIVKMGAADNFWPSSGILGPSGPCSELYYDKGPEYGTGREDANPAHESESDRFTEYWNLVFTQYDRQPDGSLPPLARKNIDTGMGLERLACIMQGVESNYETDLLHPIIKYFEEMSGLKFRDDKAKDVSFRVLADHVRATTFLLTDQVTPSNAGRGYVLRRIMRRAIRHGLNLGVEADLFSPAMAVVSDIYGKEYGDLVERLNFTRRIAAAEEEAFRQTLNRGLVRLEEMIGEMESGNEKALPGEKAFTLYDTYGFPPDMTSEILTERGFEGYDEGKFEACMGEQRQRAQAAWKGSGETKVELDINVAATKFTGYDSMREESKVLAIFRNGEKQESAVAGNEIEIVVETTPFYAESGGQVGDKGVIEGLGDKDFYIQIETTRKTAAGVFVHFGVVERGSVQEGDAVRLCVDADSRHPIMKNHTATHLLQAALQKVLGDHVKQSGSLVSPEHLRFDFTHYESVKPEEIQTIEEHVNRWVNENHPVKIEQDSIDNARARGAMALFGEKYGDVVRTVEVVNESDEKIPVSLELCGGTHVRSTGEIGFFRITSESSISAGNRRIEAVTGSRAVHEAQRDRQLLAQIAGGLKVSPNETPDRVSRLLDQLKQLERDNKELKQKLLSGEAVNLRDGAEAINGVTLVAKQVDVSDKDELQAAMDSLMNSAKSFIGFLASVSDGKVTFVCGVSDDITSAFDAGKIVKEAAKIAGGGGGGRKNRAMAGGKDASKLPDALARVKEIVSQAQPA